MFLNLPLGAKEVPSVHFKLLNLRRGLENVRAETPRLILPFQTQITPLHNDTIHLKMTGFFVNTMEIYMSSNDKKKD